MKPAQASQYLLVADDAIRTLDTGTGRPFPKKHSQVWQTVAGDDVFAEITYEPASVNVALGPSEGSAQAVFSYTRARELRGATLAIEAPVEDVLASVEGAREGSAGRTYRFSGAAVDLLITGLDGTSAALIVQPSGRSPEHRTLPFNAVSEALYRVGSYEAPKKG